LKAKWGHPSTSARRPVACLLVDHRGKSEDGKTAFFDWEDWPRLVRALIGWLSASCILEALRQGNASGRDRYGIARSPICQTGTPVTMALR
jgi:hypothetical protein